MPRRRSTSRVGHRASNHPYGFDRSVELYGRSRALVPGAEAWPRAVFSPAEAFPAYIVRAKGARCTDVDGNEYIDLLMGYGPVILGHADPIVDRAVKTQLSNGNVFSLENAVQADLAAMIRERLPAAEMAMFFKTGSDATTAALRIARRYTGRRRVAFCGYHGWHDWRFFDKDYVPDYLTDQVWQFAAWDPSTLAAVLDEAAGEFAAVIVAPEMVVPPDREVFDALVRLTHRHGAVFVLDEIKTGARTPPWTLQQRLGISADLTTLSKAIGNGHAVAAVVGHREIMTAANGVHLAGTYHGEGSGLAAALATIPELETRSTREHIWTIGEYLIHGLREMVAHHGVRAEAAAVPIPSMPQLLFRYANPGQNDHVSAVFFREVIRRGVLVHPKHMWFISGSHTRADIDRVLNCADEALELAQRAAEAFERPVRNRTMPDHERDRTENRPPRLRVAFIGCGARARMHAAAYGHVPRAAVVACCDVNQENLEAFATMFDVRGRYNDADAMIRTEAPDVVHLVTPPSARHQLLALAASHSVPLVIVEKPIALDASEQHAISALTAATSTQCIVNHQLRYHATVKRLLDEVRAGKIGLVRHIDASARLPLSEQGSHLIDLAVAFNGDSPMTSVFAAVTWPFSSESARPGAECALAELTFLNGTRATVACGPNAPRTSADGREYRHKRIAVYGTRGFVQWQMNRWECFCESSGYIGGQVDYGSDDVLAQAALIEEALDLLENGSQHPTHLVKALAVNGAVLGCYASALAGAVVTLPFSGSEDLRPKLAGSALLGALLG